MEFLTQGLLALTWKQLVMYAVGGLLIWLAVKKEMEPALLLPNFFILFPKCGQDFFIFII